MFDIGCSDRSLLDGLFPVDPGPNQSWRRPVPAMSGKAEYCCTEQPESPAAATAT
jgi:hypothetical protein